MLLGSQSPFLLQASHNLWRWSNYQRAKKTPLIPCLKWSGASLAIDGSATKEATASTVRNSSAHRSEKSSYDEYSSSNGEPEFECYGCYECFWSEDARENHHTSDHDDRYCTPCKRMFTNANNLRQVSNLSLRALDFLQNSNIQQYSDWE